MMEPTDFDWFYGVYTYYQSIGMPDADIDAMFAKIASNATIVKGHSGEADALSAGQHAVALSEFFNEAGEYEDKGAPVSWGGPGQPTVQPAIIKYVATALLNNAPHPAAGVLWMDFTTGDPIAINLLEKNHYFLPGSGLDPLKGIQTWSVDEAALSDPATSAAWSDRYDKLLRNATKS
jgi:iron(III) transport system substrate-binding protein